MSQYDFQITRYCNGDVEVRLYDKPIFDMTDEEKQRRQLKRAESIRTRIERAEMDADDLSEYYETLDETLVRMGTCDDGFTSLVSKEEYIELQDEIRKQKNARDSYRRTVNAVHDLARAERWTMFYTLTFSSEVVDRTCFESCMKKANKWFSNLKRKAPDLKYFFVPELHEDGVSWHIHGMVCNDTGVDYVDSGKKDKHGRVVYNVDSWKYGWSTATKIDDTCKASSYVLKYITKDLCSRSLGKKRYFHSRNIAEPLVERYSSNLDFDKGIDEIRELDFLDTLLSSYGVDDISRIKKVSTEHCSVTYINAHIYGEKGELEK